MPKPTIFQMKFRRRCLIGFALLATSFSVAAKLPLEELLRDPQSHRVALSPDGKNLATSTLIKGRLQMAVIDLATGAAQTIAGFDSHDIDGILWADADRIVFTVVDQRTKVGGVYTVNRGGDGLKELMVKRTTDEQQNRAGAGSSTRVSVGGALADEPGSIFAQLQLENDPARAYRWNTRTDVRKEMKFDVPGKAEEVMFDGSGQVRAVVTFPTGTSKPAVVWYRHSVSDNWRELKVDVRSPFTVLGFANDATLYVCARTSELRAGIFSYDFADDKLGALLISDKNVDVCDGLIYHPLTHALIGARIRTEPPTTKWLEKYYIDLQAGIDAAYPNLVNVITPSRPGLPVLVHSFSSTNPGKYSVYYPEKKKLQALFTVWPLIDSAQMSEQLVFDYVARDGLPILSYLTVPRSRALKALPMVVMPHDGLGTRDFWGFNPDVQFLAGMGYAVLQPQFRGSVGFGQTHREKGLRQWGLAIQDDISDGVNNLIKQGVVDPGRVCIMGHGYGGYSALMGLVRDPGFYKCAISVGGTTDLSYEFDKTTPDQAKRNFAFLKAQFGDPQAQREQFVATSPLQQAAKIRAPTFVAYLARDPRLPSEHGDDMCAALRKHEKVFECMKVANRKDEIWVINDRVTVYEAIRAFLHKYNPPD